MPQYGEATYWEERYTKEPGTFDWYQGYAGLKQILHRYVPTASEILQVGVGTSRLQEDMVRLGQYKGVTNVDYSTVAINHLREMHKAVPQLKYQVADCREMPEFTDGAFDTVIDKGTMDAILCGEYAAESCRKLLRECHRVLKPGGVMLNISYGDPLSRLPYFVDPGFPGWEDIQVYCIAKMEQVGGIGAETTVSTTVGEELLAPVTKGPFPYTNMDAMDALSSLEGVHFVYVMTREQNN